MDPTFGITGASTWPPNERTEVVPAVNQVDLQLCFIQGELRETDSRLGIVIQSWALLGGSMR